VQSLKLNENLKLAEWGKLLDSFCKTFETVRGVKNDISFQNSNPLKQLQAKRKKSRTQKEKEADVETTKISQKRKIKLMADYPCITQKRRFRGLDFKITELSFSEEFLKLIGYPVDSFVSTVLKEGLPQ